MKKRWTLVIRIIVLLFQFAVIMSAYVLEYFSDKKMGMARYLAFKNSEFEVRYFTEELIKVYLWIFIAGAVLCLLLVMRKKMLSTLMLAIVLNLVGVYLIQSQLQLNANYFFIIAVGIALVVQYVKFGLYSYFDKER